MAEPAVEAGADPERAGLLDVPDGVGERGLDRLVPAVGVEGPGVGGVAAEVQAEAAPSRSRAVEGDRAEAAAAERDGHAAVRERGARWRREAGPAAAGRRRRGPELAAAAAAPISASKRMRGISWFESGWTSWNGTGSPCLVGEPAGAPVVEVEIGLGLDEGAARAGGGVEDDDLVLVDARQRAVGPAAGGVVEHLLAGDAGAALHGADAVPGAGDRGAGQDVVELGEEQVVPGGVEPGEARRRARRRRRRARGRRSRPGRAAPRRGAGRA